LFLDFDGTLVDLAPQPEEIVVPPELITLLQRIQQESNGALAIVSGRPLDQLDFFLAPPPAGRRCAWRRAAHGRWPHPAAGAGRASPARAPAAAGGAHPGLQLELKRGALALHYRHAAHLEQRCVETMMDACATNPVSPCCTARWWWKPSPHQQG
jgi:trehalose 6-phosphate phosphatase